MQPIS